MLEIFSPLVPVWYQIILVALLGAILGSFLNVVAYRMHTGASINGRSRCFSCGHTLRWYELVPFLSFAAQQGRCRSCKAHIPRRDLWVELCAALGLLIVFMTAATSTTLVFHSLLFFVLLVVVIYDVTHLIIPNELVGVLTVLVVSFLVVEQLGSSPTRADFVVPLTSAAIGFSVYGALWLMSRGRWIGLGDAKLAIPLSLLLTPMLVFSMVVLSFWIGALVGLLLLAFQAIRRLLTDSHHNGLTMKTEIPFAPFIIMAFGLVYLGTIEVLDLVAYAVPF